MKTFNLGDHCDCPDLRGKDISFLNEGEMTVVLIEGG